MTEKIPGYAKGRKKRGSVPIPGSRRCLGYLGVYGEKAGPTVLINAAIHGNEIVGAQVVRNIYESVDPKRLSGNLLLVPVVNRPAFEAEGRVSPNDGQDMNRVFPGRKRGTLTERIAYAFFHELVLPSNAILDLHSIMDPESMVPHVRIRLEQQFPEYQDLIQATGLEYQWKGPGVKGMLQVEAAGLGIPCATIEIGTSGRFTEKEIELGTDIVRNVLRFNNMLRGKFRPAETICAIPGEIPWLTSPISGLFKRLAKVGDTVKRGGLIGEVVDLETMKVVGIRSPYAGIIVGLCLNKAVWEKDPVVMVIPS